MGRTKARKQVARFRQVLDGNHKLAPRRLGPAQSIMSDRRIRMLFYYGFIDPLALDYFPRGKKRFAQLQMRGKVIGLAPNHFGQRRGGVLVPAERGLSDAKIINPLPFFGLKRTSAPVAD